MPFPNAVYYFIALLVVLVGGFWPSYFSRLGSDISFAQHFHGISMLLWVLLLIFQAGMVRMRKLNIHRLTGKLSLLLAPLIVWSGLLVVLDNLANARDPMSPGTLNIFWFGIFLVGLFALFYGLAIYHRKKVQLHARFMAATALVFLVPGLGRLFGLIGSTTGWWVPDFFQTMWIAWLIGVVVLIRDRNSKEARWPFALFTVLWGVHLFLFKNIYQYAWWQDFANWYMSFA